MNVIAGIIVGFISESWTVVAQYSFCWSIIHVAYGYIFGLHDNIITATTTEGKPTQSYFLARFTTSIITCAIFASATFFLINIFSN